MVRKLRPGQKLEEHRDELLDLARRRRITSVKVFGSVARNADTESSDIDLLITLEDGADYLDISGFGNDAEDLFGVKVDLVSDGGQAGPIMERIRTEAVPL